MITEKEFMFLGKPKVKVKETVTGFDKKNLFDEEGKIIDLRNKKNGINN